MSDQTTPERDPDGSTADPTSVPRPDDQPGAGPAEPVDAAEAAVAAEPVDAAEESEELNADPEEYAAEVEEPDAGPDETDTDVAADAGIEHVADDAGDSGAEPVASGRPRRGGILGLLSPRLSGASMVIAVLVGLLGFALIAQVKSNSSESTLANDRPDDLVRILSDLDARKDRLNTEISTLQDTQRQLASGAQGRQAALAEAAKRADELGILAGTLAAQGPGLTLTLVPGTTPIAATDLLDTVEELRGAGAEAMQIAGSGGGTVRVVASTYFVDASGGILTDGQTLTGALTITVIGDPQTMQTAISIPGGPVDIVKQHGGSLLIGQPDVVHVTVLHAVSPMKYAHPVS